ncbi:MAG: AAA family ATPase [Actinoallomurus sp.]
MTGSVVSPVLVGRDDEIAVLRETYERARVGRPGTVLVSGEAGIGKSRLVAAAVRELPGDPPVLSGGCLELGSEGAPYVPFVAVLRDLVRRFGRDRVAALLPPGGAALGDWLPDLGPAPARYGPTRLLEEMLTLLGRVAEARPVVVVVEDLHWADASSRELFAYLARNLTGVAVLLIGTVRTGEPAVGHPNRRMLAELGRSGAVERIALGSLEHRHVAALLAAVDGRPSDAAGAHRRPRARGRLTDTAGGTSGNAFGLTRRELDVLRVLAHGRSNQQIAVELFISVNTVATHVTRVLTKLGAVSRTQAAAKARETGLLDDRATD